MDPKDRIVDYALRRIHAADEDVDLSRAVRRAWERGVAGPALGELEDLAPPSRGPVRRPRVLRPYAAAAAALLVVAVGLWALGTRPGAEDAEPVAELSRPLPTLEDGRWVRDGSRTRRPGEPIWVDGFGPATVSLPGGGSLAVEAGSRLAVEEGSVVLDWGALQASAGAAGLEVRAGDTHFELGAHAVLVLELAWDHRRPAPDQLHLIEPAAHALRQGLGRLKVEGLAGAVRMSTPGSASQPLPQGEALALALDGRGPHPLPEHALPELERLVDEALLAKYGPAWTELEETSLGRLVSRLHEEPAAWVDLAPTIEAALARELTRVERRRLLDVLVIDGGRTARRLVEGQWALHPDVFTVDHRVAMAENDHPLFQREVRALVLLHDPADRNAPHVDPTEWIDPLLPAAYLALRGDGAGVGLLHAAAQGFDPRSGEREALLAALALAHGGFDEGPWRACARALETEARAALEQGMLEPALLTVASWEALELLLEREDVPRLAYFENYVMAHVGSRFEALEDESALRALLEDLASR